MFIIKTFFIFYYLGRLIVVEGFRIYVEGWERFSFQALLLIGGNTKTLNFDVYEENNPLILEYLKVWWCQGFNGQF